MAQGPDSVRDLIRARLDERGLTMAEASRRLGRNHAYLQQFLERETPKHLPEDVRPILAQLLGVPESTLRRGGLTREPPTALAINSEVSGLTVLRRPVAGDFIDVLGSGAAGRDGSFEWNGQIVDRIPRPPSLLNAPHGYAVFVAGDSMVHRYEPGETVFVHPGRPVTIGSYVLVQVRNPDGEAPLAFLKRLSRRTAKVLYLEQFNPPKIIEIPSEDIISIHKVVGSGDA